MNTIYIEALKINKEKSVVGDGRACIDGRCVQHRGVHLFLTRIELTSTDMYPFNICRQKGRHFCRDICMFPLITSGANYGQNITRSVANQETLFTAFSQIR
ncbi:hypothetical protein T4B_4137 [Trichinella pseudospiralis]|uniref:Uncharacterized protein n=3 Tax=Trichinella pseudospiralis TaxID=6337 RepID=A0A0V1J753_TRIPS|nr:hypothetical protein T4E_593 [Trichinella pseudospiralis]KRY78511.1 hypothetical protein T4A_10806 [Trichinella pseudospiralis]KRY92461.1 hypothetical protein T4D_15669 [Trichinella pseudospiralis]KRZ30818.1 hypothetical protein T4B_4137 [Trichinella pseudospiralis]